jgi:hypothetical protein
MNCPACDREVEAAAESCPRCGFRLREAQTTGLRLYVLLGSLAGSMALYVVLVLIVPGPATALPPDLWYAFTALGLVCAGLALYMSAPAESLEPMAATRKVLLPGALAEAAAVLGVIAHFLGAPLAVCLALFAVSAVTFAAVFLRLPRLVQAVRRHLVEQATTSP